MVLATNQHVIIAGFGPTGRVLADALNECGTPWTIIELNAETVYRQTALGSAIVHGDATDSEVLKSAGIHNAAMIVFTFPDPGAVFRGCQLVRSMAPNAVIAVRTRHLSESLQARQLGADITVVEVIVAADAMATVVTAALGASEQSSGACAESHGYFTSTGRLPTPLSRVAGRPSPAPACAGKRQGV